MAYLTILSILSFHDFGQLSEKFGHGLKPEGWMCGVRCLGPGPKKRFFSDAFPKDLTLSFWLIWLSPVAGHHGYV